MMRPRLALVALLLAAAAPVAATPPIGEADIVILGEVHDNPEHHRIQARYIARLAPRAVVFEMLTPGQADRVRITGDTDFATLAEVLDWAGSGWPDFSLYQPVFAELQGVAIRGAALPRDRVRAAFSQGAAAVFGDGAARFGLDRPLPDDQLKIRRQLQFDAHCGAMPLGMMDGMVEAQRLRDAAFARATLSALDETGGPVILITGNGHARTDWAVPHMIRLAAPGVRVFSLGITEAGPAPADPYDQRLVTRPAARADPCLQLHR